MRGRGDRAARIKTQPQEWPLFAAVAMCGCAFAFVAWPWLSGGVTIPWDAKSQFLPQQMFLARALAAGDSPFWTPNVYAGWPQIADPQSLIFSPPHLLLALVDAQPSFRAVDGVTFAMLFAGSVGMILLFRDRNWHVAGALVAALAFAFGGACAARLQHTGQIVSLAYLPLALWLMARALDRSSWAYGAAAGLAGGLMALGRDQVALLCLYVLGAFALWRAIGGRPRAPGKPLAAGAIVALAVAAAPIIMTALLAADSNRPTIDYEDAGRGSLHPAHLLTFVVADLYGAADPAIPYWGPPSIAWGPVDLFLAQNMGQVYAGALTAVALIGVGILRGVLWAREVRFFTLAALLLMLYALGRYTPAFRLMYEFAPGVGLFRRPADATFVLGALVALLAGYSVHRWLTSIAPASVAQRPIAAVTTLALIAGAIAVALSVGRLDAALKPILWAAAWTAVAIATLTLARRCGASPLLAAAILAACLAVDLRWNNAPNESTGLPPAVYEALRPDTRNETVLLLKRLLADARPDRRDRVELAGIGYHWPNLGLAHGFDHVFGHNPLRLRDYARATGVGDTVAVAEQRHFAPLFPSYRSAMADLLGLRFILTGAPAEQIDRSLAPGDLVQIARTQDAFVYENPRALPRVLLLTHAQQADFAALLRTGWPPEIDPRHTVLLDRPPPTFPAASEIGAARLVRYGNTEVEVAVDAPAGGVLVLNDVWHPWWRASINGRPAEILKANVLFRAVVVPPGAHSVRFEFHPFSGAMTQLVERLRAAFSAAQR